MCVGIFNYFERLAVILKRAAEILYCKIVGGQAVVATAAKGDHQSMRRVFVAAFGLATMAFTTTAMADLPFRGDMHPQPQGGPVAPEEEDDVPSSSYARGQLGFHGMCGASMLVPPF